MIRSCLAACLAVPALALAQGLTPHQQLTRDIYRELVGIRTVHPDGDNTAAARAMARRLLDAGFDPRDVEVIEPAPRKGNLVARYRGTGEAKPILLLAHLDVVEAKPEDWSEGLDPFALTEKEGFYYGRGTLDDKAMAAIFVANLIRYRQEGFRPRRDLIVALTADEETGTHNGVAWLLKNRPAAIEAAFALNEGGGGILRHGTPFAQGVQVSEKMYLSFDFEAVDSGGHSSVPKADNPIYDLARALDRLAAFQLPARLSLVTRLYFAKLGNIESGPLAEAIAAVAENRADDGHLRRVSAVPRYNAQLRTTCVATRLEGGHADNALPQRARATVNCRLLPGEKPEFVREQLQQVAGERVSVKARGDVRASGASDADGGPMETIRRVSESMWPGAPVIPVMGAGATDGSRLRNAGIPVYGVSGLFVESGEFRAHGRDERLAVRSFQDGTEFLFRLVRALASENRAHTDH
jgi:acetylornithine deacetylase/succinyl-diaminopimelate desuccinylase-like protein